MLTHVVIFFTKPGVPDAADRLIAGIDKYLRPIPLVRSLTRGKMVPSDRPVVDQSYQVGLSIIVDDKAAEVGYQTHPLHDEFIANVFRHVCDRVVVYDFA